MTSHFMDRHFWIGPGTERVTTPSLPSSLVFLAALWLGFAPRVLHYARADGGFASSGDVLLLVLAGLSALQTYRQRAIERSLFREGGRPKR